MAFLLGALVGATGCQDTGGPGDDDATAVDDDGSPDDDSVPDDDSASDDDVTDDDTADDDTADDDATPPGWVPTLPCEEPPPWGCPGDPDCDGVPAPEDCDDADGRTWPGAREICGDGRDQDCDGGDVECWLSGERAVTLDEATVTARITSTRPWTQIGSAVVPLGDVTGDGEADLFVEGSVYGPACILAGPLQGLIEIADDDSNCAVELDLLRPYSSKLYAVDPGDINGDGIDDLVVGNPDDGPVGEEPGYIYLFDVAVWHSAVFVFYSAGLSWGGHKTLEEADATLLAPVDLVFGEEVHGVDAAQNRGCGAIVASRVWIDDETTGVAVVYGAPTGIQDVTDVGVLLTGPLYDRWGTSLASGGDANGDGWTDLLVSATGEDEYEEGGSLYVSDGPFPEHRAVADARAKLHGVGTSDAYGGGASFGGPNAWIEGVSPGKWGVVVAASGQDRTADPNCSWSGPIEGWDLIGCDQGAVYLLMPP